MPTAHTRVTPAPDDGGGKSPVKQPAFAVPPSVNVPPRGPGATLPPVPGAVSAMENPQAANALAAGAMASAQTPFPKEAPGIYDNLVRLPGGLVLDDGSYVLTAVVRELTGADEEQMARAGQSGNIFHYVDTLLRCGTVQLGDRPPAETADLLPQLLIGDRNMIGLGIRIATYGPEYELLDYVCPQCGGMTAQITFSVLTQPAGEIRLVSLDKPEDATFEVGLRHGGTASVRLPDGRAQKYLGDYLKLTPVEQNSALLRKCVIALTDAAGIRRSAEAEPSIILSMPAGDRKAILTQLRDRQPGPQLEDGAKFPHLDCGKEISVPAPLAALFLG